MGKVCILCGFRPSKRTRDTPELQRSLHSLPAKEETRILWIEVCGLKGMVDEYPYLRVCSAHFTSDDYIDPKAKEKGARSLFLKPSAVPSVEVPHPLQPVQRLCEPTTSTKEEVVLSVISTELDNSQSVLAACEPSTPTLLTPVMSSQPEPESVTQQSTNTSPKCADVNVVTPKKRRFAEPRYVNEMTSSDFATPRRTKRSLTLVKLECNKKIKEIKRLQDKNRYLKKRIMSLKELVKHLQKEGLMTEDAGDTLMAHINQLIPLFDNKRSPI